MTVLAARRQFDGKILQDGNLDSGAKAIPDEIV